MITPEELVTYGITDVKEIFYNPSYDFLFKEETNAELEGYEKGTITNTGAVVVDTGIFHGRSPQDKYIVQDDMTLNSVWWKSECSLSSDNKPISYEVWEYCKNLSARQLSGKKLYVMDCFCGANEN